MGISRANESSSSETLCTNTFSGDTLRLEISGPLEEHLSVIDVPGIFKKTTEGLTTKADIEKVRSMVREVMANPRSLMLTVVPANTDIATQEILDMAQDYDKNGIRTLGILTKPDLVDRGAEMGVIELLAGTRHALRLGWHIVRNPSQYEINQSTTADRHQIEKDFFHSRAPWNEIDPIKCGVTGLRERLQELLGDHIRREFPQVGAGALY